MKSFRAGKKMKVQRLSEDAWKRRTRIQKERYQGLAVLHNAGLGAKETERFCRIGEKEDRLLQSMFETLPFSARSYHRILRVARTIADLDGKSRIGEEHILEAMGYRPPDRNEWMRGV